MIAGMAEAGQRCDEHLHEEDRGTFHQDTMAEPSLGGLPTADEMIAFDGQDAIQGKMNVFWSMWQCAGIIWHVWQVARASEGPTFFFWDADLA